MRDFGRSLAEFIVETKYEDLTSDAVHEAKRVIIDCMACGLAGVESDRGRFAIALSRRLGGFEESSILGTSDKVSSPYAAFTNGELINALDYDALEIPPGHTPPYVVPPALATGESAGVSGRTLILSTAIGHEVATRVDRGLKPRMGQVKGETEWQQSRQQAKSYLASGQTHFIFGGAAAAGRLLGLETEKILHALGIAGHFCPIPTNRKFQAFLPSAMTKYGTTGWVSIAAVTAAMLSEMGYLGDTDLFDGDFGFWRMYAYGEWDPESALEGIGEKWLFPGLGFKPYPCHRAMHGPLDCLLEIIEENEILPGDIDRINAFGNPAVFDSLYKLEVPNHVAAQFNPFYILACAANRVEVEDWQKHETMGDPAILRFMNKIRLKGLPDLKERMEKDPRSRWSGTVEVIARGKTFRVERMLARGTADSDMALDDDALLDKFRRSALTVLPQAKVEKAIDCMARLEKVENVKTLLENVTL